MADAAELEQKFLKADALAQQGDPQAKADAKLFRDEIVRLQSAPAAKPVAQNIMPSMVDSMKQVLSEESSPFGAKVIGGMGVELDKGAMRLKQMTGNLTPADATQVQQDRQFGEAAGLPGVVGASLPYVVPGARLAQAGAAAVRGAFPAMSRVAASLFGAGAAGTVQNVTTNPVLEGESEGMNAGAGAAGGVVGQAIPGVLARAVQPITQSPAVQRLIQQGIVPTIGSAMGGAWKQAESKLASVPFLGDVIRWGANRPVQEVNLAALRSVSPEITQTGSAGIREAQHRADRAYNAVLPHITVVPDARFVGMSERIANDASYSLSEEQRRAFQTFVNQKIVEPLRRQPQVAPGPASSRGFPADPPAGPALTQKSTAVVDPRAPEVLGPEPRILDQGGRPFVAPGGQQAAPIVSGEIFKKIDSELGAKAANYRKSASASERDLGEAFTRLQMEWRELLERNAPPELRAQLDQANRMWANLTIVERAAAKTKTGDGEFTVAQLQQAVRESDGSIRKRAFAGGNARMQGLSNPAVQTLAGGAADSGTAGRAILAHTLLGGAGAAGSYVSGNDPKQGAVAGVAIPMIMAALASPMYSRAGARYMLGDYPGQQAASQAIRRGAPYATSLGATLSDYARNK